MKKSLTTLSIICLSLGLATSTYAGAGACALANKYWNNYISERNSIDAWHAGNCQGDPGIRTQQQCDAARDYKHKYNNFYNRGWAEFYDNACDRNLIGRKIDSRKGY